MNTKQVLLKRVSDLIDLASATMQAVDSNIFEPSRFRFRAQSLQFIKYLNGTSDPNYSEFEMASRGFNWQDVDASRSILQGIKHDIENDYYLSSLNGLLSADIFSDYLEMAEHLLQENYEIPAAVLIGSTLEEHLRKLCEKNTLPIENVDSKGKKHLKTGNDLNAELYKATIYNKIEMGQVEAWIKIRNAAAHGNYSEFTRDQVSLMLQGVSAFIGRNPL